METDKQLCWPSSPASAAQALAQFNAREMFSQEMGAIKMISA